MKVKALRPGARLPTRATPYAAGADLYACLHEGESKIIIGCGERKLIPTGVSIAVPEGYYLRIAPRAGLALKRYIDACAGVADSDYRGEIFAMLHNHHPSQPFIVENGDRIAQAIVEQISLSTPEWVEDLDDTERGVGGFGSTGSR